MKHSVVISFSSKNEAIVENIVTELEKNNITCWYSSRDIKSGESYPGKIVEAIENAKVILLVLTSDFNDSPHTLNEVENAFDCRKPIIPIKMESFELNKDFVYFLRRIQTIDGCSNFEGAMKKLIARLNEIISSEKSIDNITNGEFNSASQQKPQESSDIKQTNLTNRNTDSQLAIDTKCVF